MECAQHMSGVSLARFRFVWWVALAASLLPVSSLGQGTPPTCVVDVEPNDRPEGAMPVEGAFCIEGDVGETDQDIFTWTVTSDAAKTPWQISIDGLQQQQTRVQLHRLIEPGSAEEPAVVGPEVIAVVTPDREYQAANNVVFVPAGQWIVGLSVSGGTGTYKLNVVPSTIAAQPEATATSGLAAGTSVAGDLQGADDVFPWTIDAIGARQRWSLTLNVPIGSEPAMTLEDDKGTVIFRATRVTNGEISLGDIGLNAGSYRVKLSPGASESFPYLLTLTAEGPRSASREDEPNSDIPRAHVLALAKAVSARIAQDGDVDLFALPTGDAVKDKRLSVALQQSVKRSRKICLVNSKSEELLCKEGDKPVLIDIVPWAEPLYVAVSGTPDLKATYTITARLSGVVEPNSEREPNDSVQSATPFAGPTMNGRFGDDGDTDLYAFDVQGEPQVWAIEAKGAGIKQLELRDVSGTPKSSAGPSADAVDQALLKDLMLLPGKYFIALSGKEGTYTLSASSTGKPDQNAEREPNDEQAQAIKLNFGEKRKGSFSSDTDFDMYRIATTASEQIDITVDLEGDCTAALRLYMPERAYYEAYGKGKGFVVHARIPIGESYVGLLPSPLAPCTTSYELVVTRADITKQLSDIEPNDSVADASPLPPSLTASGTNTSVMDSDIYLVPESLAGKEALIEHSEGSFSALRTGDPDAPTEIEGTVDVEKNTHLVTFPKDRSWLVVRSQNGLYTIKITPTQPIVAAALPPLEMQLAFPPTPVAAFWPRSQRIQGEVVLKNNTSETMELALGITASHYNWRPVLERSAISLAAGQSERVPVNVIVEPDAWTDPIQMKADAWRGGKSVAIATADLRGDAAADPMNEFLGYPMPDSLRGGFNVSWKALGASVPDTPGELPAADQMLLHDELTSSFGITFEGSTLPAQSTVNFGADRTWPIAGIALNPQLPTAFLSQGVKDFDLQLSADGTNFETVLSGQLNQTPVDQFFALPQPREARAARLIVKSGYSTSRAQLGEWKVIADPAATTGIALDIADPTRGGHIVTASPLIGDLTSSSRGVLEAGNTGTQVKVDGGLAPSWVVGFHEDRAAQITKLAWTEDLNSRGKRQFDAIKVAVSVDSPVGPWKELGTWTFARDENARATFDLPQPVWARFVKFEAPQALTDATEFIYPNQISIFERATDAEYRSIVGEWGHLSSQAIYEIMNRASPVNAKPEADGNDSRQTAQPLTMGETVAGQVILEKDEDWFRVDTPADNTTLGIVIDGQPTVDVDLEVQDAEGKPLTVRNISTTAQSVEYAATIEPSKTYYIRILEPPHSIAVAYDLSGSLMPYLDSISRGLSSYSSGVVPKREAVNYMAFENPFMLKDFTDQSLVLEQGLADNPLTTTSSRLEQTMIAAMRGLSQRKGARAILVITDAATNYDSDRTTMWEMIGQVRPRIFAAHVGAWDDPIGEKAIMQDLAASNGGLYWYVRSQAEMDVAFQRVAAWMRRPARYRITATTRTEKPPEPGSIAMDQLIAANPDAQVPKAASGPVELILDASGSMLAKLDGKRRIEIARSALKELVSKSLPASQPVALRVFGHSKPGSCETSLVMPLTPLDAASAMSVLDGIQPQNLARTPIADSLRAVATDLEGAEGPAQVVLITDGEETCDGDPRAEIDELIKSGINVRVNIVGFAVDDEALKARFGEWARAGNGVYIDARDEAQLTAAVAQASLVPFIVLDASGLEVATGQVGGAPVQVPAGTYRVKAGSAVFEGVVVEPGEISRLRYGG